MKTPILRYNAERTADVLDASIDKHIKTAMVSSTTEVGIPTSVRDMIYNLCYKTFYVEDVKYVNNHSYTVADLCQNVKGLFQDELIRFVHNLIKAAQKYTDSSSFMSLLEDCLSYELIQMLYRNPVAVYATLLYHFSMLEEDADLITLATKYLQHGGKCPTLEWEDMYNNYMERYKAYE